MLFALNLLGLGGGVTSTRVGAIGSVIASATLLPLIGLVVAPEVVIDRLFYGAALLADGLVIFLIARSRIRSKARLKAERERYRAVVEQSNDAIYLLEPDTLAFLDANPAYCRLVGYDLDALRARTLFDIALDTPETLDAAARRTRQQGGYVNGDRRHRRLDGSVVDLYVSASRIQFDDRAAICVVARDVSEQQRYQEELLRAKEHAEAMLRLKSTFLSNMSHELRTPLTAILGYAELLAEEVDGDARQYVHVIHDGAQRLYATLNAVLDLAQLEGGALDFESTLFDGGAVLRAVAAHFQSQAALKNLTVHLECPEDPVPVYADRAALRRVLEHLLSNAVKFTERGAIRASLARTEADDVVFEVEDSGIGVESAFLPHVFDEFKQASWGYARSHEGVGLGLALARRLVEQMGGRIGVTSEPGRGSTFAVTLPGSRPSGGDSVTEEYVLPMLAVNMSAADPDAVENG